MLFYTQIKREFSQGSWKQGQLCFRQKRITGVKLEGDRVVATIQDAGDGAVLAFQTILSMGRGTISGSKCTCPKHRTAEKHCKHVAALAIWIVERGSLLRSGVGDSDEGVADENEDSPFEALAEPATPPPPPVVQGEAVLLVRGIFQNAGKVLSGLSVESGIRFKDPNTKQQQVKGLIFLTRQAESENGKRVWKNTQGVLIELPPEKDDDQTTFIERLDTQNVIYQGQEALENLAKLLKHKLRDQIVFDEAVNVKVDPEPLKLASLIIGKKTEESRSLSYEFENSRIKVNSNDLEVLSHLGRLSNRFVWKDDCIYELETPLQQLYKYANRSGVAAAEDADSPTRHTGYGTLRDDPENPLHPLAAYRLSLELGVGRFVVDPEWKEFHEWKSNFEKKRLPGLPEMGYGFDLRTYQQNGLSWMWSLYHRGLSALLADDMGLGKTHQVLAFLTTIYTGRKRGKIKQPSLVVAPTSVIAAWAQKLNKYDTGLKWHIFHGSGRTLPEKNCDLVLTTYGILQREPILRERDWHVVILDEAQAIKNAATISSQACRKMRSKFRIAMTGTPVENQSTDLWSLMEFLLPGYLGSLARFKRLYGWGRETPAETQASALKRLISPFLLRRTKAKVLTELPEKTEEVIPCEMTPTQRKAYRDCLSSNEAAKVRNNLEGEGKIDYANVLALLTRLKQICDHPRLSDLTAGRVKKIGAIDPFHSGKWEAFDELVHEAIGSNLKVVVFTQYLGMMDLIGESLKKQGIGHTDLRGDTSDRGARLEKFANDPECKVFICSLLAGGLGIDLTSASVCIHFDRWWNPAKENQATDRLHRFGQTRGVQVFKLQIPGSIEDRIASIVESKVALSGALIEESSSSLKAFSRKELLELLTPDSSLDD